MKTRQQDDRFDLALADCCRRIKAGEQLEICLADHPAELHEELARLAPLATRLHQLGHDPSLAFQTRLEGQLRAAVGQARVASKPGLIGHLGRYFATFPGLRVAVAALVVLMLALGGVGVIQAADDSLPDSPLYSVKTAREWAELQLARNEEARIIVQIRQMNTRANELERAVRSNKPRPIILPLARSLAVSMSRVVDLALQLDKQGYPGAINQAFATIKAARQYLDRLEQEAPPSYRPIIQRLRTLLDQQEQRLPRQSTSVRP